MSFLITTLAAILIFGLVVLIHEFGHFICAKKSGIQVNEFSIGMGPALFSRVKNGTRYSLRLLPIGGYVAMEGEDEAEPGEEAEKTEDAEKPGPELQEEAVTPSGVPFFKASLPRRMIVVVAGATMNLILGFVVLLAMFGFGDSMISRKVAILEEGQPIAASGIQVGDTITAINGRRCVVANDIIYELQRTQNYMADITVSRDGEKLQFEDVPFTTTETEDGRTVMNMGFKVYSLEKTPGNILSQAWDHTIFYGRMVFRSLVDLITGRVSATELAGPVGIVTMLNDAISIGWEQVLNMLAMLTINIGILNLLPLPVLDGGKLVFLIYEAIFKRPVPEKLQIWVNMVGIVLLVGLMLFATFNDLGRIF